MALIDEKAARPNGPSVLADNSVQVVLGDFLGETVALVLREDIPHGTAIGAEGGCTTVCVNAVLRQS